MAEDRDDASKTEEPTPKRLDEARRRGQVPLSREVNSWFVLLAATLALAGFGGAMAADAVELLRHYLGRAHAIDVGHAGAISLASSVVMAFGGAVAPVIGAALVAGVAACLVQIGWLFAPEALAPKLSKVSPLQGFRRLFSGASLVEFAKGLAKMAIVAATVWLVLADDFLALPLFALRDIPAALAAMASASFALLAAVVAATTAIALADLVYQRVRMRRELRMSRTEISDEFKEQEGDPTIKAKLRQIRQERARRRMMQAVPQAAVVIANPTHYAVALRYERETMAAPVVVAKGVDRVALRIREIADAHGVPIVENPPLARALHATVDLDAAIDPEHYQAVAEIIGFVMRRRGAAARPSS